ncbi:MAG: nucleotide sugar dehydrogenase, partial [Candidatus Methanomethylophilaceae archaeon]|nr:nucleotide sugar dehydrogenase [Candidatus Methanomethylophilaceae archaeon]
MKVSVIGTGYVGLSLSVLISRMHDVVAIDIDQAKVDLINSSRSPIVDREISQALSEGSLKLHATTDYAECIGSDFVIIAVPTNYDPATNRFDTSIVEKAIKQVREISPESTVVIKSTVPIGFTKAFSQSIDAGNILFSPEFLREGKALYDNLYPSRIVVGTVSDGMRLKAKRFIDLLSSCSEEEDVPSIITGSTEAESIKLFANTYLALRVAYFNELDSFAEEK